MASIHEVNPNLLIPKVAEELKKCGKIKAPDWAPFVKTGVQKERPPVDPDWWFVRCAAVLRKLSMMGPLGVSKLRTYYGGNIIRKVLQQLETAGFAKQAEKGKHKGRIVTPEGQSILDKIATQIQKNG